MKDYELVVKNDKGELALSEQVENILDYCEEQCNQANESYANIKEHLIQAMLDNNIKTAKVGKYKISVREYKDKWTFDIDKFVQEENEDIVIAFSSVEHKEDISFNLDKFKDENPELYAKYVEKSSEDVIVVDDKKLHDTLPKVWEKYATKEEGKKPSITIKKEGE